MERTTDQLVNDVAIELNEDAARIGVHLPQWSRFAQEGVVVDLHCERERFRVGLTPADLGIEPDNDEERKALAKVLTLGSRYLIPKDWVKKGDSLDSKGRECLKRHSFKTFWGAWIHTKAYATWRAENDEIAAEYVALRDEIVARYDDLIREAQVAYVGLCSQAYNRLLATPAGREGRIPGLDDREAWIANAVRRMVASTPSAELAASKYRYYWDVRVLPALSNVAADEALAQRIRLDAATAAMLEDLKRTAAEEAAGGVRQFVSEVQGAIRSEVYGAVVTCLDALERSEDERLPRNNTAQLVRLVERCSSLVFWEDPDLEKRVQELSSVISVPAAKRSPDDLRGALRALGAEARLVLLELDRPPERSGRDVGIPDDIEGLEVVARRGSTALDDLDLDLDLSVIATREGAPALF